MQTSPHSLDRSMLALVVAIAAYLVLVLPTVGRQGINWDEHTDLTVAAAYLDPGGLWAGSTADLNQTRLPMYLGSLLFRAVGEVELHDARLMSCAVAVLTLFGVWVFCRRELGGDVAAVACLLLATSPYYLAYSQLAFTEGDVFIACATVWTLVAAGALARLRRVGRATLLGLAFGLAVSTKFSALPILAAVMLHLFVTQPPDAQNGGYRDTAWRRPFALGSALLGAWVLVYLALAKLGMLAPGGRASLLALMAMTAIWGSLLFWGWRNRHRALSRALLLLVPISVAAATFFIAPPVHTTNPRVFVTILQEIVAGGDGATPSPRLEVAAFHFLVVLIKPSLLVGAGLWLSIAPSVRRAIASPVHRLLLLTIAFYVAFVLTLPWSQTRYMVPVAMLLTILLADTACRAWSKWRFATACAGALAGVLLVSDLVRSYPDLNLNGYQWVGERELAGRWSLGYRAIAQTPSDGIEQALAWTVEHAGADDRVVTLISPRHIVRWLVPEPAYEWIDGIKHPEGIANADLVITSINVDLLGRSGQDPVYDRRLLESEFEQVYRVTRAYGIEVASVWRRR
jgi:hypothetical protein